MASPLPTEIAYTGDQAAGVVVSPSFDFSVKYLAHRLSII